MAKKSKQAAPAEQPEQDVQEQAAPAEQSAVLPGLSCQYAVEARPRNVVVTPARLPAGVRFRARCYGVPNGHYAVTDFGDKPALLPADPGITLTIWVREVDAANAQGEWVLIDTVTTPKNINRGLTRPPARS